MKRILFAIATIALTGASGALAADPSESCNTGFVPPATTPAGLGARIVTSPGHATVGACNDGTVVPAPGAVRAEAGTGGAMLVFDGDPSNAATPCADGYAAIAADGNGVRTYQSSDGGFTSRARPKSPEQLAKDVAAGCVPA